jgi:hypothetical protein
MATADVAVSVVTCTDIGVGVWAVRLFLGPRMLANVEELKRRES